MFESGCGGARLRLSASRTRISEFDSSPDLEDARAAESEIGIGLTGRLSKAGVDASAVAALVRDVEQVVDLSDQFQLESLRNDVEFLGKANVI